LQDLQTNYLFQENDTLIWVAGWGRGLYWLDPRSGTFYPGHVIPGYLNDSVFRYVRVIFRDKNDNLYFGTWGDGLIKLDSTIHKIKGTLPGPGYSSWLPDMRITSLAEDHRGNIWAGTYDSGIIEISPGFSNIRVFTKDSDHGPQLTDNHITALVPDMNGNLWIGTLEKGLFIYDIDGKTTQNYHSEPYIPYRLKGNYISAIYRDPAGKVWAGANGLSLYDPYLNRFRVQYPDGTSNSLKDPVIWCFEHAGVNRIWIGTEAGGIYLFDTESGKFIHNYTSANSGLAGNNIRSLETDRFDRLWIGHFNRGIQVIENRSGRIRQIDELRHLQVQDMLITDNDWLWIGTIRNGIYRYHITDGIIEKVVPEGVRVPEMDQLTINSLNPDKNGNIWACTWGNGIYIFNEEAKLRSHLKRDGKSRHDLRSNLIYTMYQDKNGIYWVGSQQGVDRILQKGNSQDPEEDDFFVSSSGLPAELTKQVSYCIRGDDRNRLWISSNIGLICYSLSEGKIFNYGPEDGLQSYEFNSNSSYMLPDGLLFFGGVNGFNYFYPDQIRIHPGYPQVRILRIYQAGKEINIDSIRQNGTLQLKFRDNSIAIEYTALDYPLSDRNKFRSLLSGLENKWQEQGTNRYINYSGLKPGTYNFSVTATNKDGIWGEEGDSFHFRVLPPFWQTWWFMILAISASGFLAYLWHLSRVQKAVAYEKLRNQISGDLHDDIGASLTRISLYSDLLLKDQVQEKKTEYLNKIGNLSREIISSMSDIVWAVDARKDTLPDLVERMKGFALDLTTNLPVNIKFDTDSLHDPLKIPPILRQNIYLIFKEALHNAIKHSGCDTIEISIKTNPKHFLLMIRDNGRGFYMDKSGNGNGIANMQRRADLINAAIEINSDEGTSICLSLSK
jgi:ligand-binding sensor domain-containing protein